MKYSQAKDILTKYANGTCTGEERALAEAWYDGWNAKEGDQLSDEKLEAAFIRIGEWLPLTKPKTAAIWPRISIAAAIASIIYGAYLFLGEPKDRAVKTTAAASVQDAAPGKYSATLTLANGRKIKLTDAIKGEFAKESGISITKTADGKLMYEIVDADQTILDLTGSNTLSTANGETYVVTLPDKTKIWLNAASSLTYPLNFAKSAIRDVKLTGEAYFEVAKDKARPFIVKTFSQEVKVLGTHFNIKSYADEPEVKTTLVEGIVSISPSNYPAKLLVPGQQAIVTGAGVKVINVNADQETAWKKGDFVFNSDNFESTMNMIARWYDVDIIYDYKPVNPHLAGQVSRSRSINEVLKRLQETEEVKFKIEGRRIRVIK